MLPKNKYKNTVHSCSYCESRSYLSFHPFDDHDDENDDSLVSRNSFFFFSLSTKNIFSAKFSRKSEKSKNKFKTSSNEDENDSVDICDEH